MIASLERSGSRALTCGLRSVLSRGAGSGPRAPSSFLRDLRRFNPRLQLIWVPNRWVLYTVTRRGLTPAEDALVKEVELVGPGGEYRPLGPWVLEMLRRYDKTDGGTIDPAYADRQFLKAIDDEPKERDAEDKKFMEERHKEATTEFTRYAMYDRKHFVQ